MGLGDPRQNEPSRCRHLTSGSVETLRTNKVSSTPSIYPNPYRVTGAEVDDRDAAVVCQSRHWVLTWDAPDDIGQALVAAVSLGKWFPDQLSDIENKAGAFLARIHR